MPFTVQYCNAYTVILLASLVSTSHLNPKFESSLYTLILARKGRQGIHANTISLQQKSLAKPALDLGMDE